MSDLRWTDDHCHLHFRDGRAESAAEVAASGEDAVIGGATGIAPLVAEARDAGVQRMITVGCDVEDSRAAIEVAAAFPGTVFATAGVHPHEARHGIDGLEELLGRPEVVAVGECGLDFHYDHSPRDEQREVFARQIALAHEHGLPLVVHTREAWAATFDVLDAEGVPERTIFHCFTGGAEEARRCLDLGAMLSFSGIITFRNAADLREAAALTPLDRLLVETDAPFLTPEPHRGRRNRPALVPLVGAGVAAAQGRDVADIAEATWSNASSTYGLA